ncbi:MBL fold metallo-hydrolase [Ammonicoccus fulvus]|uniref:MBL fold metallo-hydrolase n=1 Tax=Ammonicoccus fulvus TaxID=3138240 RepID=A0ABZ3FLN2_9ACTN
MSTPTLPRDLHWVQRPFPNANLLLLRGSETALVDSGFGAHAEATELLAAETVPRVDWVVNTHWHSDHVGGNALFQHRGAGIVGSHLDATELDRRNPGCCVAEYLDQPVPAYTVDRRVGDADRLLLGEREWEVLAIPGHTAGHLALWDRDDQLLVVGDTVSSYDVGWVNVMLDGVGAIDTALESAHRLRACDARLILPGHGPLVDRPGPAIDKAIERLERQRDNVDLAVDYGAKRILGFALMIRGAMTTSELDAYLHDRHWVGDAAALVNLDVDDFVRSLVDSMLASGALLLDHGRISTAAEHEAADPAIFDLPFPRDWN